jgi:hypothetical protein
MRRRMVTSALKVSHALGGGAPGIREVRSGTVGPASFEGEVRSWGDPSAAAGQETGAAARLATSTATRARMESSSSRLEPARVVTPHVPLD